VDRSAGYRFAQGRSGDRAEHSPSPLQRSQPKCPRLRYRSERASSLTSLRTTSAGADASRPTQKDRARDPIEERHLRAPAMPQRASIAGNPRPLRCGFDRPPWVVRCGDCRKGARRHSYSQGLVVPLSGPRSRPKARGHSSEPERPRRRSPPACHCHAGCDALDILDALRARGLLDGGDISKTRSPNPSSNRQTVVIRYA
jgi:hypothetical protein